MSSTGKWVNELCVYMIENYIAIKKNKLQIHSKTWKKLKNIKLNERRKIRRVNNV